MEWEWGLGWIRNAGWDGWGGSPRSGGGSAVLSDLWFPGLENSACPPLHPGQGRGSSPHSQRNQPPFPGGAAPSQGEGGPCRPRAMCSINNPSSSKSKQTLTSPEIYGTSLTSNPQGCRWEGLHQCLGNGVRRGLLWEQPCPKYPPGQRQHLENVPKSLSLCGVAGGVPQVWSCLWGCCGACAGPGCGVVQV